MVGNRTADLSCKRLESAARVMAQSDTEASDIGGGRKRCGPGGQSQDGQEEREFPDFGEGAYWEASLVWVS
eukprot:s472_g11.t1